MHVSSQPGQGGRTLCLNSNLRQNFHRFTCDFTTTSKKMGFVFKLFGIMYAIKVALPGCCHRVLPNWIELFWFPPPQVVSRNICKYYYIHLFKGHWTSITSTQTLVPKIFVPLEVPVWVMTTCSGLRFRLTYINCTFEEICVFLLFFFFQSWLQINTLHSGLWDSEDDAVHKISYKMKIHGWNQLKISVLV